MATGRPINSSYDVVSRAFSGMAIPEYRNAGGTPKRFAVDYPGIRQLDRLMQFRQDGLTA
jgi:hypothetical protein